MKYCLSLLLLLVLLPLAAHAQEMEGAYLSGEDLQRLESPFEDFLEALADILVEKHLLPEADRDAWILYQRGDFLQNGGYGTIAVMYTPGLLSMADESVTMRRFSVETGVGALWLETLHRYSVSYSPLPGLPLDTELLDAAGNAISCRFRWVAPDGSFLIWDGGVGEIINVGATYISDGRPLYWYAEPVDGVSEQLTLELLHPTEDQTLAVVALRVLAGPDFWSPEGLQ